MKEALLKFPRVVSVEDLESGTVLGNEGFPSYVFVRTCSSVLVCLYAFVRTRWFVVVGPYLFDKFSLCMCPETLIQIAREANVTNAINGLIMRTSAPIIVDSSSRIIAFQRTNKSGTHL